MNSQKITAQSASFLLVGFMTLLHLFLAFNVELGGDEAHYALYGLMPDWSYFDHPPMIGWLQIIPMWLAPYDWSARLVPIVLYAILNYLLYQITVQLFPAQTNNQAWSNAWKGFASLVVLNTSLILSLMGMAMLPDNPLMVAVLALVLVTHKLLQTNQLKYWILLGLFVGLAALSKYTAVTVIASLLLVLLIEKKWSWLTSKGLWIAIIIALILITPILYWNAIHEWASFIYQIDHGTKSSEWRLSRLLQTQAIQLVAYTPFLFIMGWWMMLKPANYQQQNSRLLLLFSLPITLLFAWGSGYEKSLPHWVSLAWVLLIPIMVNYLWQVRHKTWVKVITAIHIIIFGIGVLILHSLLFKPWIDFPDHKNPLQGDYGWPQAAKTAIELQNEHIDDSKDLPLFVSNWSYASHLTWYSRPQPVYITSGKQTQFEFWFGKPKAGMNGILVAPHYETNPPVTDRLNHFTSCKLLKTQDIKSSESSDAIIVTYYYYLCHNFIAEQPGLVTLPKLSNASKQASPSLNAK
ncbi:glycosyltransferase family 39 protein [Thiomicrorhabdus sp. Milos-T2]|uniref:ArnT family glycosyltransferase n=1 Tax=Thiomicrorhabdus sp. Milos-T2 TaxID=90814 RepID=UPI000493CF68|nr:glycosyltransferase family 39 protein [Thiomicrorhabdus sp. Milos-T2]